jgi:alkylated DNA repair dioxygenase AlkB
MIEQIKLFDDTEQLMLPQELIDYKPGFFKRKESDQFLTTFLSTVPWQQSKVKMYDKEVWTPRLSAWFGERPIRPDDKRTPIALTPELLQIKERIEAWTGITFDGVLLNYYRDNNDSVAWHSDKDTVPGLKTEIASVLCEYSHKTDYHHFYLMRSKTVIGVVNLCFNSHRTADYFA